MQQQIKTIEIKGIRVLTTEQLAKSYGTTAKILQYNFSYNKKRYVEGKHYISLQGDALKTFKANLEIQGNLKYAHTLYLWTEKGALLHAKSLNTDKAWEVYDYLVDFYFRAKEQPASKPVEVEKPKGREVVDNPENQAFQKIYKEILDTLTAMRILVEQDNKYICKRQHNSLCHSILVLTMRLMRNVTDLSESQIKLIHKVY